MAEPQLTVVPDDYSPPAALAANSFELALLRRSRLRSWPVRILVFLVCLWLVDIGITVLIHRSSLQRRLTDHLAAAFGRPVEVGHYNFSLWTGPLLEAESVTVGEDPRFGNEYFVRAESLRVRVRWKSLLRGHVELGTLSLNQPSLNVVRNSAGEWNLAEWLPRPNRRSSVPFTGPSIAPATLRFERIEVDGGRVNFKTDDEKSPFALVSVDGSVEPDGAGRWRMNLEATPWRASTLTQQAGEIHVAGHVGGTSSRLLPALLDVSWTDASVSDALRFARGEDSGVRGNLALSATARTANGEWDVQARAEMRQIHRWNLALRADNPDLNFLAQMKVNLQTSDLDLISATLEAPHSTAHLSGRFSWDARAQNDKKSSEPPRVEFSNSTIDLRDAFAWLRAFHSGVSDNIVIQGTAGITGALSGWPPRVESLLLSSDGADLVGTEVSLRPSAHIGRVDLRYDPDHFSLSPVALLLGPRKSPSSGVFWIDATYRSGANRVPSARVIGNGRNIGDVIGVGDALGWNFLRGWDLGGPFRCDLRWQGVEPWNAQPIGLVEIGDVNHSDAASLSAPFLNQPIEQVKARMDLKQGNRHVLLSSAQALGASWTGTFDRRDSDRGWKFALSADHLAAADLDRWLNPRWRETLIDRVLPFLNSRSSVNVSPDILQADGHLAIDELVLAPYLLHDVEGDVELGGRHFEMTDASAKFYGGDIRGSVVADVGAMPSYRLAVNFSRVDLAAMTAASTQLEDLFSGSASGEVSFLAHGASRADLMASLECDGSANLSDGEFHAINLASSLRDAVERVGVSIFPRASARFTCADRKIQFQDLILTGSDSETDATGIVDFKHNLDFRVWVSADDSSVLTTKTVAIPGSSSDAYHLAGTLATPQLSRISQPPHRVR